jgi:hypothetical protein
VQVTRDGELMTLRDRLTSLFRVDGLPTLVILDPEGEIVKLDACENVATDPEGRGVCRSGVTRRLLRIVLFFHSLSVCV